MKSSRFFVSWVGSEHCRQTGYFGRIAFHELALVTEEMRTLISANSTDHQLGVAARRAGYRPLRYDALKKALLGLTTLEEIESKTATEWILDEDYSYGVLN